MRQPRPLLLPLVLASACCLTPVDAGESGFFLQRFFGGELRNPLQQGHEFYQEGNFQKAVDAYYKNAIENRQNDEAWYHLGMAYLKAKEFDLASNAFQAAIQLESKIEYRYQLCLALVQGGHVRPALIKLRQVIQKNPKHDMSWTLLGRCYESLGQQGQAKSSYLQALDIAPHQGQALFLLERLTDVQPQPLYLGEQKTKPQVLSEPTKMGQPTGPLPVSRVISDLPRQDRPNPKSHPDIEPLLQSYHLSRDAHIKGLSPTAVKTWQQPKVVETEISIMPSPPVEMTLPQLDISPEDL
jgi:tetratricopeptide (TPR) repeat protein